MEREFERGAGENGTAVIVGASLSGLMTAIALAQEDVNVIILDKVGENRIGGSGLRVDGGAFVQSKTEKLLKNLASGGKSSVQLWSAIESRLRTEAKKDTRIDLRYDTRVVSVGQDENSAWALTGQGEKISGDMLIGADGHNSRVRMEIAPHKPDAAYAGYMGWIASVREEALPVQLRAKLGRPKVEMFDSFNGFKFGSVLESEDGAQSGSRRIGCTWYDNTQSELLRRLGCLEGMVVRHSLKGNDIPEPTLEELARNIAAEWPEPWRTAALEAIKERSLIGIPIKEYVPDKLAAVRMAIVGDAAHVPAPVTASGFNESLQDAVVLGKCAAKGIRGQSAVSALEKYESLRLEKVRRMVQSGKFYSDSFGRP